eukprot:COSAG05_NODE_747_length_7566_cov_10.990759_1_plen_58_part_00
MALHIKSVIPNRITPFTKTAYNEHLAAIKQKKKKSLTLNKPIYAGMYILDLSRATSK